MIMAATAYASLVSLLNTMDQIRAHPLVSTFLDKIQNNNLSEMVDFFIDFVEGCSDPDWREVENLVRRIADAAHDVENLLEVHAADRICGRETPSFVYDLQLIIEDMKSIKNEVINGKVEFGKNLKEEVIKVREETGKSPSVLPDPPPSSSSAPPATADATTMVGFDDYKHKLLDDVLGHDVGRHIISITGMGGIGKTTLARSLYQNPLVLEYFDVRAWITVSQNFSARKVFLQALSCLGGGFLNIDTPDEELSYELYKILFNRRYLIVLDDVWSVEIWHRIKIFFPENNNGSRIIITTRLSQLVDYIDSSKVVVNFLDEKYSWELFCEKTFPQQDFPLELEEVGKKIVKKCGGLPLSIIVIGGLLRKSPRTQEYWEKVEEDKSLILDLGGNILGLSYNYLPVYLKPCFLYLGLHPEDSNIDLDTLIKLSVAEGFIKSSRGKSLEEVAESYFNDLLDRNLLSLDTYPTPSKKSISIHGLVRDLCIQISEKENFYCVQRSLNGNRHFVADQRAARFYPQELDAPVTPSISNPLIVLAGERAAPFKTRLLRVFCCDERNPYYALQEVNMRFLQDLSSKHHHYLLPSLLSRFWRLQTLIVSTSKGVIAPAEIWKMPQLRHINISHLYLPVPPPPVGDDEVCILQNLQTLKTVQNLIFTEEVCKRIPNIKELHIFTWQSRAFPCYHLENLGCFNKLECLNYQCILSLELAGDWLQDIKFPSSLKELTLNGCKLEWSYMAVIASLPHLETLHLEMDAFAATEWVFIDEKFVSLKRLDISSCRHVTIWNAVSSNFPVLENLSIWHLSELDEIPSGIGEIPFLQSIYLSFCSESATISAVEILHEQESFENLSLRVVIQTLKPELVRQKVKELGLTCQNLDIR